MDDVRRLQDYYEQSQTPDRPRGLDPSPSFLANVVTTSVPANTFFKYQGARVAGSELEGDAGSFIAPAGPTNLAVLLNGTGTGGKLTEIVWVPDRWVSQKVSATASTVAGISTVCCGAALVPALLTLTYPAQTVLRPGGLVNYPAHAVPLVYNATGFAGAGWYGCSWVTTGSTSQICDGCVLVLSTGTGQVPAIFFVECLTTFWRCRVFVAQCGSPTIYPVDWSCCSCVADPSTGDFSGIPFVTSGSPSSNFDSNIGGGSATCSPFALDLEQGTSTVLTVVPT